MKSRSNYGTEVLIWGQIEVNCGIVSASAMFLRPLFKRGREQIRGMLEGSNQVLRRAEENETTTFNVSFTASEKIVDGRLGVEEEREQVPAQTKQWQVKNI